MKILIISHDASRTGAPILLLNLVKALNAYSNKYETVFLIKQPSYELLQNFQGLSKTVLINNSSPKSFINKVRRKFLSGQAAPYCQKRIREALKGVDIVISNTATNGDILPIVRKNFHGPIISYIHELKMAFQYFSTEENVKNLLAFSDHFLVPSRAVGSFLIEDYKVEEWKISNLDYYIPSNHVMKASQQLEKETIFTIGGAGTTDWRKGVDLFIQVASIFKINYPHAKVKFVWKGAHKGNDLNRLLYDVDRCCISNNVVFEEATNEMSRFYNSLDVFLLTSREDPYPLVVLEAAKAGVPTICFRNSGGAVEFIEKSNGIDPVSYLNLSEMAERIYKMYTNRELLYATGQNAKLLLERTHNDPAFIGAQFDGIIAKF